MSTRTREDIPWQEPAAQGFTRGDVSHLATNIASKLGYEPGASLEPVVERLGGKITYGESPEELESGSIQIRPDGFTIHIAMDTSPLRDRFTIAHELGHYVLHYLYPNQHKNAGIQYLRAQRYGADRAEYEANWFAAAFLMPADRFRAKYAELRHDPLLVSDYFKVSTQAATVRAKSLGLDD